MAVASSVSSQDQRFMRAALDLGQREMGQTWPNPAVGALVVSPQGVILGRGWTQKGGRPHAEPQALAQAGHAARGATLYVTLEPCSHHGKTPPCAEAIIKAGIARVVCAADDPDPRVAGRGYAMLEEAGITVVTHVLESAACRDHIGHCMRVTRGRPFVAVKLALSADEKIAAADKTPVRITGEETARRVHLMRAQADAIAVGIGTVLADDPLLTCRLAGMEERSPVRVIFDGQARLPLHSALVQTAKHTPVWILCNGDADLERREKLRAHGVHVLIRDSAHAGIGADLEKLAEQGITRLFVEGGAHIIESLGSARLIDRLHLFQAPQALGMDAFAAFQNGLDDFIQHSDLQKISEMKCGTDRYMLFERTALCSPAS